MNRSTLWSALGAAVLGVVGALIGEAVEQAARLPWWFSQLTLVAGLVSGLFAGPAVARRFGRS